jgi:division protein CdvB (Snf7/Vps24/ESCRT-III family)
VGVLIKTLHQTVELLRNQVKRLEMTIPRLERHEHELFNKCVEALEQADELSKAKARMYAEECAEVRKLLKTTIACKLALEQALLRLETVESPQDLTVEGVTVAQVLSALRKRLATIIPEISYNIGLAEKKLTSLIAETVKPPFKSNEAEKLLKQAEEQAEEEMKSKPEIP